jgi:putative hydrolase of the HAD superfamily
MKAILFDLDDTLYPEIEFVKSGFAAVSSYLAKRYGLNEHELLEKMLSILEQNGRGKVFDMLLADVGYYSAENVKLLVYLYRSHLPTIHPYPDTILVLKELKKVNLRLGILTDGMASVQRNKIRALGINDLFNAIMCTDELGKECWKPSAVPFKIILELLQVLPQDAIYVGNDIGKDFFAPNELGMTTIRIDMKHITNKQGSSGLAEAKHVIFDFNDILRIVRK